MKKKLLLTALFTFALHATEPMLPATPYEELSSVENNSSYFLEVGSEHCKSCQAMGRLLYKEKEKYPKANLFFINIQKEREVAVKLKIQMIPTQLIFDANNSEVYRHVGKLSQEELEALMKQYLQF